MSSAVCFNLDKSEILSSGNGLRASGAIHGHDGPFVSKAFHFELEIVQQRIKPYVRG